MDVSLQVQDYLNAVRGRFSPNQLSALLNMDDSDIHDPQNYLVWFHERFHYLQSVFTPYGHLKWGCFRSVTADIVDLWSSLTTELSCKKKIPIASYLDNPSTSDLKIATSIWLHDSAFKVFNLIEYGYLPKDIADLWKVTPNDAAPTIQLSGQDYKLNGIDIFESFAKYQEAMLGEIIGYKSFNNILDPCILNPEYYSALFYFVSKLGGDRILEFPITCELSLAINHLPRPNHIDSLQGNCPGWRFIKIVDFLEKNKDLRMPAILSSASFFEYSNKILSGCNFETLDSIWDSAEEYAQSASLTMASEMLAAISYKKAHPWILSYPFQNLAEFWSQDFNRFNPIFTITNNAVFYNLDNISSDEMVFENHFQALALQICGCMSERCKYPNMLQCGFSYFGLNNICPHQATGECSGEIDCETLLPEFKLDEEENILCGCSFEAVLNTMGTSIQDIEIKNINQRVTMETFEKTFDRFY